jgi:hypothetical protein
MTAPGAVARPGLADIPTLKLSPRNQEILDQVSGDMLGAAAWRRRKRAEVHGLLALSQLAPRLRVRQLDLRTELHAIVELEDTPVPCMKPGANAIEVARRAVLAIAMPAEILVRPIPGTYPVRVLEPGHVFHPNCGPANEPLPALCLGAKVLRGTPLREIVLACYAALTLQAVGFDTMDPAGVMNRQAAEFFQSNTTLLPLTAAPFLVGSVHRSPHPVDAPAVLPAATEKRGGEGQP